MSEQLTPELRFPEFDGENNFYNKTSFKDIFDFSTGKNIKQNEASPEFDIPCVRYGELYHMYNEVIDEVINYTNLDESELRFSEGDEILLPSAGEDPLDIGSASALILPNIAIGRTINVLKPKEENTISTVYTSYYINQVLKRKISTFAKGFSISNVYNSDLKRLSINLPIFQEQQKIANFLKAIDKRIKLLKAKKEALEAYKTSIMQKLFSQEIRFKQEDGSDFPEWEEKKLGDLCDVAKSGGTPKATNKEYYDGDIPFLAISDMTSQGKYLYETSKTVAQIGIDNSSSWILPKNTLIYSMYASVGFASINKIELATSQAVMNMRFKDGVDLEYIYYFLLDFKKELPKYIETGTQGNINASIVKNIKVSFPEITEQIKISTFLSRVDSRIEAIESRKNSIKDFKKFLLQKMFV